MIFHISIVPGWTLKQHDISLMQLLSTSDENYADTYLDAGF